MTDTAPAAGVADLDGGDRSTEDLGMDSRGTSTVTECLRGAQAGMPEPHHRTDGKLSTRLIVVLLGSCRHDAMI